MHKLLKPKTVTNLRIVGNLPIDPGGTTPPQSPKTPKTRNESIGFIFGDPISHFDPARKPKKCEVIKLWMHLYDTVRKRIY
jgi:hypothetical protein